MVTDKQGAEVFAAVFGWRVTADDKLLLLRQFDFNPRATSPAALVKRIRSFGHQAFEPELPRYFQKLFSVAPQLFGKPDIVRSAPQELCK
jgi:hypothetical protein